MCDHNLDKIYYIPGHYKNRKYYTCDKCMSVIYGGDTPTIYHCTKCNNYDMCPECKSGLYPDPLSNPMFGKRPYIRPPLNYPTGANLSDDGRIMSFWSGNFGESIVIIRL